MTCSLVFKQLDSSLAYTCLLLQASHSKDLFQGFVVHHANLLMKRYSKRSHE